MEVVWLLGLQGSWRYPLCRDHGARYTGKLAVTGTREMVPLGFFLASGSSAPVRIKRCLCKFFIGLQQGLSVLSASVSGAKHKTSQCLRGSLHETVDALANWAEANWVELNAASRHVDESKRSTRFQHRMERVIRLIFLGTPCHRLTADCVLIGP